MDLVPVKVTPFVDRESTTGVGGEGRMVDQVQRDWEGALEKKGKVYPKRPGNGPPWEGRTDGW